MKNTQRTEYSHWSNLPHPNQEQIDLIHRKLLNRIEPIMFICTCSGQLDLVPPIDLMPWDDEMKAAHPKLEVSM